MRPGRLALCELAALVLLLGVAHLAAGDGTKIARADAPAPGTAPKAARRAAAEGGVPSMSPAARCSAAQHAIGHYRRAYTRSRSNMGLAGAPPRAWYPCDTARRRAVEWRSRAQQAARELARWTREQYAWRSWLPAKWYRVARCETGVNWQHDSGTYVSAFGIYRPGYADDAHRVGNMSWDETIRERGTVPTPREQYDAALSHYRAHGGFSGWGCRGA